MQMPLVSKFLCYLEAAARRELGGLTPAPCMDPTRRERERSESCLEAQTTFTNCHCRHTLVIKAICLLVAVEIKIPKPTLKHLFWCQQSQAVGVSNHYQNMIPKPNCLCVSTRSLYTQLATRTRMEAGQCKCLWFQSSLGCPSQQQAIMNMIPY